MSSIAYSFPRFLRFPARLLESEASRRVATRRVFGKPTCCHEQQKHANSTNPKVRQRWDEGEANERMPLLCLLATKGNKRPFMKPASGWSQMSQSPVLSQPAAPVRALFVTHCRRARGGSPATMAHSRQARGLAVLGAVLLALLCGRAQGDVVVLGAYDRPDAGADAAQRRSAPQRRTGSHAVS